MKSTIYVNKQAHNNKKLGSKGCVCVCVCVCGHMMKLKY